ncbi:MAG: HAMP domain-containing sensor histidine kinase, partial [Bacilli bacterium]
SYKLISRKLLIPISNLRKDMLAYKYGTIPTKREKNTSIDELQNNFIDLTEALESEKEKQNQIIASISHDIKTPLTSIMGYASRLENVSLTPEKEKEYITKINSKSLVMKDIINEFDDYLGCNLKDNIKREVITIKELIISLKNDFEDDLKEQHIKLKIKNKTNINNKITIDIIKIKRVFNNIISNSIRYLDKTNKQIVITISKKDNLFYFEIEDNGKGAEPEIIEKIFDPLFTTDTSRKISGLGLSICNQIVKIHGGTIKAINNNVGGLTIIFTIQTIKTN